MWLGAFESVREIQNQMSDFVRPDEFGSYQKSTFTESDSTQEKVEFSLFGEQFFDRILSQNTIATGGVITPEYPLGPGDILNIYLGDKAQQEFKVQVSVDGKVYIPTVGVFDVYGQTVKDFHISLDERLKRLYNNYIVDVMLLAPKQVRISVVGEVRSPGNYTLNALNTALDAILNAGGPTELGSLRNIQLFRNDSLLAYIDLYEYLLEQKSPPNIYMQNGDRLFVPVRKAVVQVSGEVYREKIYELNAQDPESIDQMIELAGGATDMALVDRIELSRMGLNGERKIYYFDNSNPDQNKNINWRLENHDRIHVYSVKDKFKPHILTILGEIKNPGIYEYEENMRVSGLVMKAGGVLRSSYLLKASLAKVDPQMPYHVREVNLETVLNNPGSDENFILEPDDQVFIRKIPDWQVGPLVEIKGEVMFPGFYPIVKGSTSLSEVVKQAGGLKHEANVNDATLTRPNAVSVKDKEFLRLQSMSKSEMSKNEYQYYVMKQNAADVNSIVVDFYKLLVKDDTKEDVILQDGDIINIPKAPKVVTVIGRVAKNGGIVYKETAGIEYYIEQAGGYTWDADAGDTKVIKVSGEILDSHDVHHFSPGDRIWVPRKPDRNYWEIFRDIMLVAGQVATVYLVVKQATD